MSITTTEPMYAVTATPRSTPVTKTAAGEHATTATSAQFESPSAANPPRSALHEAAARYDVRHMKPSEMRELAQLLYDEGIIGKRELFTMTVMTQFPAKVQNGRLVPLEGESGHYDYMERLEKGVRFYEQHGFDSEGLRNALNILHKLEALKDGGMDSYV